MIYNDRKFLTGYYSSNRENMKNTENTLWTNIRSHAKSLKSISRLIACDGGEKLKIHTFVLELLVNIKESEIKNVCIKILRPNSEPIIISNNKYECREEGDSTLLFFQHNGKKTFNVSRTEIKNYMPRKVIGGENHELFTAMQPHLSDLSIVIESAAAVSTYVIPVLLFTKNSLLKGKPAYCYISDSVRRKRLIEFIEGQQITYTKASKINANMSIDAVEATEAEIASITRTPIVDVPMDLIEPEIAFTSRRPTVDLPSLSMPNETIEPKVVFTPRKPTVDLPPLNIPMSGNIDRSRASQKRKLDTPSTEFERSAKQKRLG